MVVAEEVNADAEWADVEDRLRGFLQGRIQFATRTPATPQSLNLQGLNWCAKNEKRIGVFQHPKKQAELVGRIVLELVPPSLLEERMVNGVYGEAGETIALYNQGMAQMRDPREDRRHWWAIGGTVAALTGALVAGIGRPFLGSVKSEVLGSGLLGVGVAGVGAYGVMRAHEHLRGARRARWY